MSLKNPLLIRYWFYTGKASGFGVTAYSLDDAKDILKAEMPEHLDTIKGVIEDVDVQILEARHIQTNMGLTIFRGIWYPCLNLRDSPERGFTLDL